MDQDRAVGLDQQEPGGKGKMGFEPANVINRASGYDKSHAVQTTVWRGKCPPWMVLRTGFCHGGTSRPGEGRRELARAGLGQNGGMPRSNRPRRPVSGKAGAGSGRAGGKKGSADVPELDLERARAGIARRESAPDGEWMVRTMTAKNAEKTYICPECSTAVLPGVAHLVVWKDDHLFGAAAGLAERRHWHTNCWKTRSYRYR
ncbi:hypothetical protein SAMN05444745_101426 [Arthrobacter sp. OV608]|nr:hypothetical protein SAMN05444745_101426 [Arthrobacter sp. OV608]